MSRHARGEGGNERGGGAEEGGGGLVGAGGGAVRGVVSCGKGENEMEGRPPVESRQRRSVWRREVKGNKQ